MPKSTKQESWTVVGALAGKLADTYRQPALSNYHLSKALFELYRDKSFRQIPIRITKETPNTGDLTRARDSLIKNGILSLSNGLPGGIFRYMPQPLKSTEEIICSADPFAYVSHLSAMEFHGLTDRLPMTMFITTLPYPEWKTQAAVVMQSALGTDWAAYQASGLPRLTRPKLEKVERKQVHCVTSAVAGAYINVRESAMRVSSLGRTYVDMLRRPELCGGINHVIDVYSARAQDHLELIVAEVATHGNKIERARAGFILETYCNLTDLRISAWTADVQRGGSRKLDASAEYVPIFSERWGISINVIR